MTSLTTAPRPTSSFPRALLVAWALLATALAAWAPLSRAPFLVPLSIVFAVIAGVVLHRRSPAVRAAVERLDVRALLAVHVLRAPIGILFLVLHARGALPAIFAVRAGVGDALVGLGAIVAIFAPSRRRYLLAWNVLGLLDIAMSVATGQKVLFLDRDPTAIATVQAFPFPLIPFLVVPAVVLTHLAIFARLRGRPGASGRAAG